MFEIHQKLEMLEEICTEDRATDVGDCKQPGEVTTEAKVEGEGTKSVSRNGSAIGCLKGRAEGSTTTVGGRGRYEADLSSSIHQETQSSGAVRDKI